MTERVAIVGSRRYPDLSEVAEFVSNLPKGTIIVSGGAQGVDATAEEAAGVYGFEVESYRPDYAKHGKGAPLMRNKKIAEKCDRMIAFWDGNSRGTLHAITCAEVLRKPVTIRRVRQRGSHGPYRDWKAGK